MAGVAWINRMHVYRQGCMTLSKRDDKLRDLLSAAGFLDWLASLAYSLGVLVPHRKSGQMLESASLGRLESLAFVAA